MSTSTMNDILATLQEGKEAIEAQPGLLATIAQLEQKLRDSEEALRTTVESLHHTQDDLTKIRADLKAKEADYESATFRGMELEDQLKAVEKSMKDIMGFFKQPEPEPKSEAVKTESVETKPAETAEAKTNPLEPSYVGFSWWAKPDNVTREEFERLGGQRMAEPESEPVAKKSWTDF